MPAIVPFDTKAGWYAATKQKLGGFGTSGTFQANGRPSSFFLCNVGKDKQIDFYESYDDDICIQINVDTGQPLGNIPCVSDPNKARALVNDAIEALEQAA